MDRTLLRDGLGFPECPRWHDGCLWVSDIARREVLRITPDGDTQLVCRVDGAPSGLGWLPDGTLLIVSMHDRRLLRFDEGGLRLHADLSSIVPTDLNDMVVDDGGRAYVGNFGYDASSAEPVTTAMVLVTPDGTAEMQPGALFRPNGCVVTADRSTLIVAETRVHRLTAFTIAADGILGDQCPFAVLPSGSWCDGICLDGEGAVWVADPKGNRCFRVLEGGRVTEIIETSPMPTTACMLGGHDRRTLFLTMAPVRPFEEAAADPQGRIETVEVAVPGAGLP